MGKKINIAQFGAFDVNSFGDSMFPVATRVELEKRIKNIGEYILFSPVGTENAYNSNGKIYPYQKFEEVHQSMAFDVLIIGGGELLHFKQIDFDNKTNQKTEYSPGYIWKEPVKYAQKYNIPYIFHGIGVPYKFHFSERSEVRNAVEHAGYVGVRDVFSLHRLEEVVEKKEMLHLLPDSLWLLEEYFDKNKLEDICRKLRMQKGSPVNQKYIVVQYGTTYQYKTIAKELKKAADEHGWKIVLLPVNYCHEDLYALQLLYQQLENNADFYDKLLQPIEIAALISGAAFFFGTSLHGNLTASVYGVKTLAFDMYGTFVSKLDGLLYWKDEIQNITIQPECIVSDIRRVLKDSNYEERIRYIRELLIDEYDFIANKIIGNKENPASDYTVQKGIAAEKKCYFTLCIDDKNTQSYLCYGKKERDGIAFDVKLKEKVKVKDLYANLPLSCACQLKILECRNSNQKIAYDAINIIEPEDFSFAKMAIIKLSCCELQDLHLRFEIKTYDKEKLLDGLFEHYNNLLNEKTEEKKENLEELRKREEIITEKDAVIAEREEHIRKLIQSEQELQTELTAMRNSRTWRLAFMLHKPVLWCFPEGSKRRLFMKIICRLLRHPVRSIKMLSPRKIRHFFYYLKEEGPGFVAKRIDESMQGISIQSMKLDMITLDENKPFDQYEKLCFPKTEHPEVSIVIPVYNQFAYTYHCLQSILNQTGTEVTYEIIIANDCSTDDTTRLEAVVENIHIITNEQNLRFLKNCNHAAQFAKGKYILFLNNDTQVQKDWLAPLVHLMESSQDAGMVGSKLIYANGMLQEAGGIVWKDASAWNYGNRSNPTDPEYNYVKETDYISGAAIMIRTSLWKEIGGFDESFAPAYYEDTDLAFEVRKHGYKVLYQPLSAVIHFEGISNGTDVSSGQKSYQIANQKKFQKKWKTILEEENFRNGENVFLAKDRAFRKKTLLMVDHYVPMYDKDAGSRCMFYYLNLFVNMGYNVKFIGDNFYKHEPYTTTLQQMGVEVLYGDYYYNNWKDWLKSNGKYFDYVFLSRPHISIKYIDAVREYTKAKVIYFGHDLHYLREMREYELTGNEQSLKDSKEWKKTELELMRKADVSYYLSNVELAEIAKVDSTVKVRRVPINIYTDIPDIDYRAENRKDIIFVGGFGHPPNIDAVKWLGEEIMPKVWEKNPDIVLHVVGSKPPQEIQAFSGERMIIHGFVSDEDLEEMYRNIKLAIVPLRYGAGIKGKIIEAMMRGIPMITTNIGIEGIEGAEEIAKVSDDANELANFITDIYDDIWELEKMALEEHQYIIDNYSLKNAVEILGQDFVF